MSEKSFEKRIGEIWDYHIFEDPDGGTEEKLVNAAKEADAKLAEQAERIKILEGCNKSLDETKAALRERIKELEAELLYWQERHSVAASNAEFYSMAQDDHEPHSPWLPASSPPENEIEVIVLCHDGFKLGCCIDGDWLESHDDTPLDEDFDVIGWMPIPAYTPAPVERSQEEEEGGGEK